MKSSNVGLPMVNEEEGNITRSENGGDKKGFDSTLNMLEPSRHSQQVLLDLNELSPVDKLMN